jgi:hypothetical protein
MSEVQSSEEPMPKIKVYFDHYLASPFCLFDICGKCKSMVELILQNSKYLNGTVDLVRGSYVLLRKYQINLR